MGHVFHPGHEALHGITVVVTGASGRRYVGRYHETTERGVVMHDVAVHDPGTGGPAAEWIAGLRKFGVRSEHRFLLVPAGEPVSIVRLTEWKE
jgi:hypothetical protein